MLTGLFETEQVDGLLLEELVAAKLEGTLHEIPGKGGAKASCESASTFVLDHLAESANHAAVVGGGIKLDPSLDSTEMLLEEDTCRDGEHLHVNRGEGAMSDGTAESTSNGEAGVEVDALWGFVLDLLGGHGGGGSSSGDYCAAAVSKSQSQEKPVGWGPYSYMAICKSR